MSEKFYISYLRVSTTRQGQSGLGLEAQRATVLSYIKRNGNRLLKEFIEVESGKHNQRVELQKALEMCKETGATLVIARLDRLSRNMTFISQLMDAKIKFICCDFPEMDDTTIFIIAAFCQREARLISERTSAALQAKKAREPGYKFGAANMSLEGRKKAWETIKKNANEDIGNRHAFHYIKSLKEQGLTLQAIAYRLDLEGYKTRKGKKFSPTQVMRLWNRFGT